MGSKKLTFRLAEAYLSEIEDSPSPEQILLSKRILNELSIILFQGALIHILEIQDLFNHTTDYLSLCDLLLNVQLVNKAFKNAISRNKNFCNALRKANRLRLSFEDSSEAHSLLPTARMTQVTQDIVFHREKDRNFLSLAPSVASESGSSAIPNYSQRCENIDALKKEIRILRNEAISGFRKLKEQMKIVITERNTARATAATQATQIEQLIYVRDFVRRTAKEERREFRLFRLKRRLLAIVLIWALAIMFFLLLISKKKELSTTKNF